MKYLFILLLFSIQLFPNGKIKAITYLNNYSKVKLMVDSPMIGEKEAKIEKTDINHLSNIKVKANDTLLFNVNVSPCLAENPLLKFSYRNINPLSLTLEYTNNNGIVKTNATSVNHKNTKKALPQKQKLLHNAKSYPNQIKSIQNLFGDITLIEDGIALTAPRLAENGGNVPINIRSDIKFKSIALFIRSVGWSYSYIGHIGCGEGDEFSLVSQWFSTPYSIVDFDIRVKITMRIGEVIVVLEAEDGKFYTAKKEVDVSLCGAI